LTNPRSSMAAALLLDLRTPLARLSLAAQRFGREAARPTDRSLASGMQDAVNEIDARIDRILPLLVDAEVAPRADLQPAAPLLESLAARVRPALDACDITLTTSAPPHTVRIETHAARRLAATLVRGGAAWVGPRGSLELGVLTDGSQRGIELCCARAADAEATSQPEREPIAPELSTHADRWVVTTEAPERIRISAWLAREIS